MCSAPAALDEGLCRKCFADWYGTAREWSGS